jgi:hypothetical protein
MSDIPTRRHRSSSHIIATCAAIAIILLLILLLINTLDPQARAARELASYQAQAQADRLSWADDLLYVSLRLLLIGAGVVALAIAWRRWGWRESIGAQHIIAAIQADRQHLPASLHTLHYHNTTRVPSRVSPPAQISSPASDDQANDQAEDTEAPTCGSLIERGQIGKGNPLILGYEDGHELTGSWLDLYATITAGLPGTGKTTTQRFFAIQTALHGAQFAVADPHAGAADDSLAATLDPLRSIYLCEPASEPKAILEIVRYVADIGEKRVRGQDQSRIPIVLWLDELTGLLGRSDVGPDIAELLERIAQEYRKRWIYLSASGQIWTAARTTSELRDSFASVLCHRMRRNQARLILPTEEATQVERLSTGRAILWRTSGLTSIVTIPNTTSADVRRVAGLITDDAPTMPRIGPTMRLPSGIPLATPVTPTNETGVSQKVATPEMATPASESGKSSTSRTAESLRAAALFFDGKNPAEIVYELRGIKSSQGKTYQKALDEILDLIREGGR